MVDAGVHCVNAVGMFMRIQGRGCVAHIMDGALALDQISVVPLTFPNLLFDWHLTFNLPIFSSGKMAIDSQT